MSRTAAQRARVTELINIAAEKGLRLLETSDPYRGQSVYYLQRGGRTLHESFELSQIERFIRLRVKSDDEIRALWREAGGKFWARDSGGQLGAMPEAALLLFLRKLGGLG